MSRYFFIVLFLITVCLWPVLTVFAEDEIIIINTGDDWVLPDEEFGLPTGEASSSQGILTGKLSYSFTYNEQKSNNPLNQAGVLFELNEKTHNFIVDMSYDYFLAKGGRVFLGMALQEASDPNGLKVDLTEAFISESLGSYGTLVAGKQKLNFGPGFGWTPTGISNAGYDLKGVYSLRWSVPYNVFNLTSVIIPPLTAKTVGQLYERFDLNLSKVNFALSGYISEKGKPRFGVDIETTVSAIHLYMSLNAISENLRFYLQEGSEPGPITDLKSYTLTSPNTDEWKFKSLIGANYTLPGTNNTFLMLEYYHDSTGLKPEEIAFVADAALYCTEMANDAYYQQKGLSGKYLAQLGMLNNYFSPGVMGQNYLFGGIQNIEYGPFASNCVAIANIDDHSGVIIPELIFKLTDNTNLSLKANLFFGKEKTEYSLRPVEQKVVFGTITYF